MRDGPIRLPEVYNSYKLKNLPDILFLSVNSFYVALVRLIKKFMTFSVKKSKANMNNQNKNSETT